MTPWSIRRALENAVGQLAPMHSSARLDAEVLLAFALGRSRSHLHTWPEQALGEPAAQRFGDLIARRVAGEPVAYLTGRREFWSLELEVSPDTQIPRPETETLVEQALARIPEDSPLQIADLGTGSGAVALAIAHERPACRVLATEHSAATLRVAARNAERLRLSNIRFVLDDWCASLGAATLDMIVSNPPYVAEQDPHLGRGDVQFEPRSALVAGREGLDAIADIAEDARRSLRPDGLLLLEHADQQADSVSKLLIIKSYSGIRCYRDDSHQRRITVARRG
jgi:release factor glutamine methyltransferase